MLEVAENNTHALKSHRARKFFELHAAIFLARKLEQEKELLPRPCQCVRFRSDCIDCSGDDLHRHGATADGRAHSADHITSGTLLDPYIGSAAVEFQLPRVAQARGLAEDEVRFLVAAATERPFFGFLGKSRVDVLMLNIALDWVQRK